MSTAGMTTTTTMDSSSAQKRVSLEGGDEQNQIANAESTQGEQSRKRCKHENGELEKLAISPDSTKKETSTKNDPLAESSSDDDDDDACSVKSDPQAETDDEELTTPRTDMEEIVHNVAKRLWSDDFEETAAALVSFCKLTEPEYSNSDEHLNTAFIRGAPVLIARVMSMNRVYYEIQKNGCLALARLAGSKTTNAQQIIVDIGGLNLCRRAAVRYEHRPAVQAFVCHLIGSLLQCPQVRELVARDGLPTLLQIMKENK
jgi:hypothetical protein